MQNCDRVLQAFVQSFSGEFVQLPQTNQEIIRAANEFENLWDFLNVWVQLMEHTSSPATKFVPFVKGKFNEKLLRKIEKEAAAQ